MALWRCWTGIGLLLVVLAVGLTGTFARDAVYGVLSVAIVVAIVVGVRANRIAQPLPWLFMAAGQGIWAVADVVYWIQHIATTGAASALWSDVVYLSGYPVLITGVLLLAAGGREWRDIGALLDSLTVALALAIPVWVLVVEPSLANRPAGAWNTLVDSAAYPLLDIWLIAGLVWLYAAGAAGLRSMRLLLVAAALLVTADVLALTDLYTNPPGPLFDTLWLGSYVFWGAAALHPSAARIGAQNAAGGNSRLRVVRLAAAGLAVLWAPTLLALHHLFGRVPDVWVVLIGSSLMFLLITGRLLVAVHRAEVLHRERDVLQRELTHAASHDPLTGLPNRVEMMRLLSVELGRDQTRSVALLFVDLDRFKSVNDTFGHATGDEVLRVSAARVRAAIRRRDVAARIGGDEFVVLLPGADADEARRVAERLVATVSEPVALPSGVARIGASVGIALTGESAWDGEALLLAADEALYQAKDAGRGVAVLAAGRGLADGVLADGVLADAAAADGGQADAAVAAVR